MTKGKSKAIFILIAFVLACFVSQKAYAENCSNLYTQLEMNICAKNQSDKADAELNAVYEKLNVKISPEEQAKLQAAEKAWEEYRTKQCAFDTAGTKGGSAHPMIVSECYAYRTRQHMVDLQEQLDCKQGNLSCGGQ